MSDAPWKPGNGQKITRLYAWVAAGADGGEGIIAGSMPGMPGITPLIGADRARIESYREMAERMARQTKSRVRLKVFTGGTVIDEIGGYE